MNAIRFNTIWDTPLENPPNRRRAKGQRARNTERFLTIWSRPVARLPGAEV
jgi:hypothetical protein